MPDMPDAPDLPDMPDMLDASDLPNASNAAERGGSSFCVFCGIAEGAESALFFRDGERRFTDSRRGEPSAAWSEARPDVYVFENQFLFFDLTSLVIPAWHSERAVPFYGQQHELWRDLGEVGATARDHGEQGVAWLGDRDAERAPSGFRVFCNFGGMGEQSQPHAHLQVHAARELDRSRFAPTGEPWLEAVIASGGEVAHETESTLFYNALPVLEAGRSNLWQVTLSVGAMSAQRTLPRLALLAVPRSGVSQRALWGDVGQVGADAVEYGVGASPGGFRLLSNFPGQQSDEDYGPGHVLLLGGSHLGLYADYF